VHLRRVFGFGKTSDFDPFLLLDGFRNDIPEDYLAGFPWHPHRGIETITYVLAGEVEHGDSMGNRGSIAAGDGPGEVCREPLPSCGIEKISQVLATP
jgi:redox-sensitive bicupin YhaK (pirin superfamily)